MAREPSIVSPPDAGVYRLARAVPGPFESRPWQFAHADGTFGNRFDDPAIHLPPEQKFQVLYCATKRHVVFGETLASLLPSIQTLGGLRRIRDEEPFDLATLRATYTDDIQRVLIRADWRLRKVVGYTVMDPQLRFIDLGTAQSSQYLRGVLAQEAVDYGATDIDQSLLMESNRGFTRVVARHFYEQMNEDGSPKFAGIRYISRHDTSWECWAVFADRMVHVPGMPGFPETIHPDDPDLLQIAGLFDLTVEIMSGHEQYYRP
jgi:hypothetical protein